MRIAFIHPGLHRVSRGSEVAFETIAQYLMNYPGVKVTLFGSGESRSDRLYRFQHINNIPRERFEKNWPKFPVFRNNYVYEEFTFVQNLWRVYRPSDFDITIACSYPFINWFLTRRKYKHLPAHIFVTQNGEHPAISNQSEYCFFTCDGLICTNPEYFEHNKCNWPCSLITNGVDPALFFPGVGDRAMFGLPNDVPIALMVSALIPSKRVLEGIRAAAQIEGLHLVVCGDGPERDVVKAEGKALMGDRFHLRQLPFNLMPEMYRSADLLMHLSLDEPFGNIYLEAMATGLPIVAHDREVTRWIVEDNAVLVDSTQPSAIVEGILQALKYRSHDDINSRISLIKKRFTWEVISQKYYQFLSTYLSFTPSMDLRT